mmetsp:Transcript_6515/g.14884  ORF Transcript_6515/g.14884 Transcript_6515/m.14884 type:complete len:136 (-) Transcript_6515:171-578(-)|eukprot:767699-Hanusia_phi.AAC.3
MSGNQFIDGRSFHEVMNWQFDSAQVFDAQSRFEDSKVTRMSVTEYLEGLPNDSPDEGESCDSLSAVIFGRIHPNTPTRKDVPYPDDEIHSKELNKRSNCSPEILSVGTSSLFAESFTADGRLDWIFTNDSYNVQK